MIIIIILVSRISSKRIRRVFHICMSNQIFMIVWSLFKRFFDVIFAISWICSKRHFLIRSILIFIRRTQRHRFSKIICVIFSFWIERQRRSSSVVSGTVSPVSWYLFRSVVNLMSRTKSIWLKRTVSVAFFIWMKRSIVLYFIRNIVFVVSWKQLVMRIRNWCFWTFVKTTNTDLTSVFLMIN